MEEKEDVKDVDVLFRGNVGPVYMTIRKSGSIPVVAIYKGKDSVIRLNLVEFLDFYAAIPKDTIREAVKQIRIPEIREVD